MATTMAPRPMRSAVEADISLKDGAIYLGDKRSFVAALEKLPPGNYVLRIDPAGKVRETVANNRYWASLRDIATQRNEMEGRTGDQILTTKSLHAAYKAMFNGDASTTELPPDQFDTYILRVQSHAASEHGVEFQREEPMFVSR